MQTPVIVQAGGGCGFTTPLSTLRCQNPASSSPDPTAIPPHELQPLSNLQRWSCDSPSNPSSPQLYILFPSKQSAFLPTYGLSISVNSSALLASSWSQMNSSLPLISTERYKQLSQVFLKGSGRQVSHLLIVLCSSHLQVSAAAADTISFPACQLYPLWLPTAEGHQSALPSLSTGLYRTSLQDTDTQLVLPCPLK